MALCYALLCFVMLVADRRSAFARVRDEGEDQGSVREDEEEAV